MIKAASLRSSFFCEKSVGERNHYTINYIFLVVSIQFSAIIKKFPFHK